MTVYKGIVRNNTIELEKGTSLPEGAEVEVRLIEHPLSRDELFERVRAHRIDRPVGMDEILEEDKKDREERADQWLQ